jgi:anti-sigma B factor antagonist
VRIVPEQHSFRVHLTDGLPVVSTPAELDVTNAVQLCTALSSAGGQCATVVVDMFKTVFCDSASLSTLLQAHQRVMADGGEVRLVITAAQVLRIFALTGVDRLFPIFVSLTEALGSVPASPEASEDPSIVSLAIVSCRPSRASAARRAPGRGALGGTRTPNLQIRRSEQVVQDRPSPVVGWADIPELSTCVGRRPAAWLQHWLQSWRI